MGLKDHYDWMDTYFRKAQPQFKGPCWTCLTNVVDERLHDYVDGKRRCIFGWCIPYVGHLIVKDARIRAEFVAEFGNMRVGLGSEESIMKFFKEQNTGRRDWIVLVTHVMNWWYNRGKQFGH